MGRMQCSDYPCYAPVFRAVPQLAVRLALQTVDILIMAGLIIVTLGFVSLSLRGQCTLNQLKFRVQNRAYGNPYTDIPLKV